MAVTITVRDNIALDHVGQPGAHATTIVSGFLSGIVQYQIRKHNQSEDDMNVYSTTDITDTPMIINVSNSELNIVLATRTKYEARARQTNGAWSAWVEFTTGDYKYSTPDSITQLSDNLDAVDAAHGPITVTVTNTAKSAVTETAAGATVVNSDTGYADTGSITETAAGATVVNG
jgi:hypothetical protein